MELSDMMTNKWRDRGYSPMDYRVLDRDLKVICTTKSQAKAERIAELCNGTIHCSKELK